MTEHQEVLIRNLRIKLLRAGYPEIFIVSNEELEAAEDYILEDYKAKDLPSILLCGKHGLYFKGSQLVLEVKE